MYRRHEHPLHGPLRARLRSAVLLVMKHSVMLAARTTFRPSKERAAIIQPPSSQQRRQLDAVQQQQQTAPTDIAAAAAAAAADGVRARKPSTGIDAVARKSSFVGSKVSTLSVRPPSRPDSNRGMAGLERPIWPRLDVPIEFSAVLSSTGEAT
uniref:Uncharacterized protein n=1 Tax=Plectus sambesii TaxID=2011161 RepID=A0A914VVM1_9BILA